MLRFWSHHLERKLIGQGKGLQRVAPTHSMYVILEQDSPQNPNQDPSPLLGGAKLILNLSSPTDRLGRPRGPGSDPGPADRPTGSVAAGGEIVGSGRADRPTLIGRLAG